MDGFGFCPAKLFRDDVEFVDEMRRLTLAWKLGKVPDGHSFDTMDAATAERMLTLIVLSEEFERLRDFKRLSMLFGGKPEKKPGHD